MTTVNENDNNFSTTDDCGANRRGNFSQEMLSQQLVTMSSKRQRENQMILTSFPENFDVREKFGKRCPGIKRVFNQGQCKSGWVNSIMYNHIYLYMTFDFIDAFVNIMHAQ